ncbi:MAG: lycopene cyclase domain-containing protein [Ignavibacteria bacterium]|nr:lycopene cyclase domain-containing protein [Ignavibacteria bacterium]
MTYIEFLLIFTVIPIFILLFLLRKYLDTTYIKWLFVVSVIAFVATAGWDNYAVYSGIWHFPEDKTLGIKLFYVPVEEYIFFFLQTYTTGLVQFIFIKKNLKLNLKNLSFLITPVLIFQTNEIMKLPFDKYNYLFHLFSWGGIFILIQIIAGRKKILNNISKIVLPSFIMTLYFSIADSISIGYGIWDFDPMQTIGVRIFNIPLEEILFFLVTNILITEAMILFLPLKYLKKEH